MIAPPNVPAGLVHTPMATDGVRYRLDGRPIQGVTDILRDNGFDFPFVPEHAMERGEVVHAAVDLLVRGILDLESVHPDLRGYVESYDKLWKKLGFEIVSSERVVYSPVLGLAGRLDQIPAINGRPRLWDLKTSPPAPWARLQTGGYASMLPPSDRYMPRAAVELHKDGSMATIHPHDDFDDIQEFFTLATATKIRRKYGIK